MGKQRRPRQKLHAQAKNPKPKEEDNSFSMETSEIMPLTLPVADNPFANVNINFAQLKKSLLDDTHSVKSFKSVKSGFGDKAMTKKEKLKLRKELLLRKIDTVNQLKKEAKMRNKRKKLAVVGDINPMFDALPDIPKVSKKVEKVAKPKSLQKAAKRKKTFIQGVEMYKKILGNKDFKSNPLSAITDHIKATCEAQTPIKKEKNNNKNK